tara:strand:- start:130 stop:687 length:558 start_codon:yes stop_codon:yes gene_type:complete
MKILIKRDITGTSQPAPDQIDVGELVLNAVTGKLYTKLTNGNIMSWSSDNICFESAPTLSINHQGNAVEDTIPDLCCIGDAITFQVAGLRPSPALYTFVLEELTTNSANIEASTPTFENYTESQTVGDATVDVDLRKATIPMNIDIDVVDSVNKISIFKFIVTYEGNKILEKLLTAVCKETIQEG